MEFMGIGPLELLMLLVIAFIVFGPGRLPEVARGLGKGIRGMRKAWFDLTREVSKEVRSIEAEAQPAQSREVSKEVQSSQADEQPAQSRDQEG